jgi:hypothetical protein
MGVGGLRHPPGMLLYQLYRRLGGPQCRSGRVWKISSPKGFDHRTVHPVASHYTYWANPAPVLRTIQNKYIVLSQKESFQESYVVTLRKMRTTVNPRGIKTAGAYSWKPYHTFMCRLSGNIWEPQPPAFPVQACTRIIFLVVHEANSGPLEVNVSVVSEILSNETVCTVLNCIVVGKGLTGKDL